MKDFIRQAYAIEEAMDVFDNITKDDILKFYTELDCVYNLLESLGIVSIYTKNELLKDFIITDDMGTTKYICVGEKYKVIPIDLIISELRTVFTK